MGAGKACETFQGMCSGLGTVLPQAGCLLSRPVLRPHKAFAALNTAKRGVWRGKQRKSHHWLQYPTA